MFQWGLDVDGLQTVAGRSTGQVKVSLVDGQPSFEIMEDQAYDFVKPPELEFSSDRFRLLYHGSLILRGDRTHVTLADVIAKSRLPRFVDINIRQPHFQRSWVAELLWGATWVKLNDAELAFLSGRDVHDQEDVEAGVRKLRDEFGDATYFVTCGAKGAYAVDRSEVHFASAPPPEVLRDTVGAGDAFASATIAGLLAGWSTAEILESGVRFASRICGITGATSMETSLYQEVVP
jgi:fructokinase